MIVRSPPRCVVAHIILLQKHRRWVGGTRTRWRFHHVTWTTDWRGRSRGLSITNQTRIPNGQIRASICHQVCHISCERSAPMFSNEVIGCGELRSDEGADNEWEQFVLRDIRETLANMITRILEQNELPLLKQRLRRI